MGAAVYRTDGSIMRTKLQSGKLEDINRGRQKGQRRNESTWGSGSMAPK